MEKKEKQNSPKFDYNKAENVYADTIEINIRNDTVSLGIAVRDRDMKKAIVSHKIFMTLSHFLKFSDVCNNLANDINNRLRHKKNK